MYDVGLRKQYRPDMIILQVKCTHISQIYRFSQHFVYVIPTRQDLLWFNIFLISYWSGNISNILKKQELCTFMIQGESLDCNACSQDLQNCIYIYILLHLIYKWSKTGTKQIISHLQQINKSITGVLFLSDSDVPVVTAAPWLPQGPLQPPRAAGDWAQLVCYPLVPHCVRLTLPTWLCG